MDEDLEALSRDELIKEVKRLRAGSPPNAPRSDAPYRHERLHPSPVRRCVARSRRER